MKIVKILLLFIFFTSCEYFTLTSFKDWKEKSDISKESSFIEMVDVVGGESIIQQQTVFFTNFQIGKYEVTYAQWYKIRQWASDRGYSIASLGSEGDDGTAGNPPTSGNNEPVTLINWRSAIVWCNALSEYEGFKPIYYTDAGFTNILKSCDATAMTALPVQGSQDYPYVNWKANGYRLPTVVEWEYAGRGGQQNRGCKYAGSNDLDEAGWSVINATNTNNVGLKKPNELGAFDMTGNAAEFCYEWKPYNNNNLWFGGFDPISLEFPDDAGVTNAQRFVTGGDFSASETSCRVGRKTKLAPEAGANNLGFRVARRKVPYGG